MEQEQFDKLLEMLKSKNSNDVDLAFSVINNSEGNFMLEMQKEKLKRFYLYFKHLEEQQARTNYYHGIEERLFYGV